MTESKSNIVYEIYHVQANTSWLKSVPLGHKKELCMACPLGSREQTWKTWQRVSKSA